MQMEQIFALPLMDRFNVFLILCKSTQEKESRTFLIHGDINITDKSMIHDNASHGFELYTFQEGITSWYHFYVVRLSMYNVHCVLQT